VHIVVQDYLSKARAVVGAGGGKHMERASFESHVPVLVAEKAVQTDQGRVVSLIAPSKPPVLQMQLFKVTTF
jgi:hypothetical protein